MKISALFIFISILFSSTSYALSPETRLTDEASEQRAMKIFLQVRCLSCQGQVIESSDTAFSFGMRKLIRQKISAGKSDEEIKTELTNEFGEDILIEPKISGFTGFFLWFLPLIFAIIIYLMICRRNITYKNR